MPRHRYYYWIVTQDDAGKDYIVSGGATEDEARQRGMEMLGGLDFDIKRLPTIDMATASRMIKGERLLRTHSLTDASRRAGHERSIKKIRHRIGGI